MNASAAYRTISADEGATVRFSDAAARRDASYESCTWMTAVNAPWAVGVPASAPDAAFSTMPGGNAPAATVHVALPTRPLAAATP